MPFLKIEGRTLHQRKDDEVLYCSGLDLTLNISEVCLFSGRNLHMGPSLSAVKVSVVAIAISQFIWEEGSDSKLTHIVVVRIQLVSGCGTKVLSH